MFAKTQLVSLVFVASAALGVSAAGAPVLDDCMIDCSNKAAVIGNCSSL